MMKLFDVRWKVKTAGPSPDDNNRTEVFLFGCKKAASGNPCKGCFNFVTWDDSVVTITHDPSEIAENIINFASNKYVTIGGGEPTDQIDELIVLCHLLKKSNFHIMVYTWKKLSDIMNNEYGEDFKNKFKQLIKVIDMLVDGQYIAEERTYREEIGDGALNSVGSGNQIIWDLNRYNMTQWDAINCPPFVTGYAMREIQALWIDERKSNDLKYIVKNIDSEQKINII